MLAVTPAVVLAACGLAAALLAGALHVLIFWMESFAWEGPLARKTFGGTPEEARPHAFYAYNQGFYNLFLAIEVVLGTVLAWTTGGGLVWAGFALVVFGCASMLGAAVALAAKSSEHRGAAAKQGALTALALVCLLASYLVG